MVYVFQYVLETGAVSRYSDSAHQLHSGALFFFASLFYPPLFILGVAVCAALIVVGLVENLDTPRPLVIRLVAFGVVLVLTFWVVQQIYTYRISNDPKTLDQLESEIQSMGTL